MHQGVQTRHFPSQESSPLGQPSVVIWLDRGSGQLWAPARGWLNARETAPLLWRFLNHLVTSGGVATKESLVEELWSTSYHPLHHDQRVQGAARRLRNLLRVGEGVRAPVTGQDGTYQLYATVRELSA